MNCYICLENIKDPAKEKYDGYHNGCVQSLFGSLKVSPILDFDKKKFLTEYPAQKAKGMSISGVQPKLPINIESGKLAVVGTGGTYIIKPTPEHYEHVSENEHISMLIGKLLSIDTPKLGLVKFQDGELAYIIKRFDRIDGEKVHQEDMTQIFGLNKDSEGRYKYGKSYEEVGEKIRDLNGGNLVIAIAFFERVLFNYLIQNGDFHLKNVSLQADEFGLYGKLTPNYDSLNTRFYYEDESEFALDFLKDDELTPAREKNGFVTRADFNEFGKRLGVASKAIDKTYDNFAEVKSDILSLVDRSHLSQDKKEKYKQDLLSRYGRLGII